MALQIIDDAIQAHGGAGVSQDFGLAASWAGIRTLRLADGPGRSPQPRDRADRVREACGQAVIREGDPVAESGSVAGMTRGER